MSKREIEFKMLMDRQEAAAHLENLARSIKEGKVVVEKGNHFVSISPGERIAVEIACYQKKEKEKIAIELSWSPTPPAVDPKESLNISSQEPSRTSEDESDSDVDETHQEEERS
jgi:amphi-Trp domain-containing protein